MWIVNDASALEIRPVVVAHRERDHLIVADGLAPDDKIITSALPIATHGMAVRVDPQ